MALWSELARTTEERPTYGQITQQLMLIPEAPILVALLLIGLAYNFPPLIGALAALTVANFVLRLLLLTTGAEQLRLAHYEPADRLARTALRLYPWSVDAITLRAQGLLLRGEDEEAEALLRRAAQLAPDNEVVQSGLAGALLARGEFVESRAHALRAQRLVERSSLAAQHLAWLALHVDDDPVKAQHLLSDLDYDRLPLDLAAPLMVVLAEAQLARKAVQAARETIRRLDGAVAVCAVPRQAELCYHLGRLHDLSGGDGRRHFRQSVALDPHGRYAHAAWQAAAK